MRDKKGRNGSILKILLFFQQNYRQYLFYDIEIILAFIFGNILPISQKFWKCIHFFVLYCSVSCKSQDNIEFNRKKHGLSGKLYITDFLILFWFAYFFYKKSTKCWEIIVNLGKCAQWMISNSRHFYSTGLIVKNASKVYGATFDLALRHVQRRGE